MKLDEVRLDFNKDAIEASPESAEQKFERLAVAWKLQRQHISSPAKLVMCPAYQSIIGMGETAIPLLLRALEQELDQWFWALRAITETDPVPFQVVSA